MFRALCDHHQEVKIVLYGIWYRHTLLGGRPVRRLREDSTCAPEGHLQMLYKTFLTSWWWAQQWSKHVDEYNKIIIKQEFVHQVG